MIGLNLNRRLRAQDGFTLTEMLITVSLTGVVMAAAYLVLLSVGTMSDQIEARSVAAEESRLVFDRLTRDLRQSQEITDGKGVFEGAEPRLCSFYSDLDYDGVPELVKYFVQDDSVYRTIAQATTVVPPYTFGADSQRELLVTSLQDGWTGDVFEYYRSGNPPTEVSAGNSEDISAVKIQLINTATVSRKTAHVDASTWVKIRSVHNSID